MFVFLCVILKYPTKLSDPGNIHSGYFRDLACSSLFFLKKNFYIFLKSYICMSIISRFQNARFCYIDEPQYASGDGALQFGKSILQPSTSKSLFPMFVAGSSIKMPTVVQERVNIGGTAISNYQRHRLVSKPALVDGNTEHYINNMALINAFLAQTEGSIPSTKLFHWQDDFGQYEAYGVFAKSMEINIPEDDAPRVSFTWVCAEQKHSGVGNYTISSPISTPILLRTQCSFTIDSVELYFKSIQLGFQYNVSSTLTPYGYMNLIGGKEINGTITTEFGDADIVKSILGTTIAVKNIAVTLGTFGTLTISNVELNVESPNETANMEMGIRQLQIRVNSTASTTVGVV